jgi:hypothetical protein
MPPRVRRAGPAQGSANADWPNLFRKQVFFEQIEPGLKIANIIFKDGIFFSFTALRSVKNLYINFVSLPCQIPAPYGYP